MYPRREANSNVNNRSYANALNGGPVQYAEKKFCISNESSGQQKDCLSSNGDQKMDFSIFHGQNSNVHRKPEINNDFQDQSNSNLQRKPAQINNDLQDRSHQQPNYFQNDNQASNSRQNTHVQNRGISVPSGVDRAGQDNKNCDVGDQHFNVSANASRNTLQLMGVPKPKNTYSSITQSSTSETINTNRTELISESTRQLSFRITRYGGTEGERMCIFTGTVEKVIKWGKIFQNHFCYYEVIAGVVSIADGKIQFERTMLLRDKKGPILQVTYYSNATHINIEDFHLGQMLRVVGRIIGPNIMSAFTIRAATNAEIENLHRICYVSSHAVSTLCGSSII